MNSTDNLEFSVNAREIMIGAMLGAACYVLYSGVPENERITRFTDFVKDCLWPADDTQNLEQIAEWLRWDVEGSIEERRTRPSGPYHPLQTAEAAQALAAELVKDDRRFEASRLALAGVEKILGVQRSRTPEA
jgi:hypothetical protein